MRKLEAAQVFSRSDIGATPAPGTTTQQHKGAKRWPRNFKGPQEDYAEQKKLIVIGYTLRDFMWVAFIQ